MAFDGCCPDCKTPGDDCPLGNVFSVEATYWYCIIFMTSGFHTNIPFTFISTQSWLKLQAWYGVAKTLDILRKNEICQPPSPGSNHRLLTLDYITYCITCCIWMNRSQMSMFSCHCHKKDKLHHGASASKLWVCLTTKHNWPSCSNGGYR